MTTAQSIRMPQSASPAADREYCRATLPAVSRTFALAIRLLPPSLSYTITVAYLLCRIADTVEDATELGVAEKRRLLAHLHAVLEADGPAVLPIQSAFAAPTSDEERLAACADIVIREYRRLEPDEQAAIRPWVQEMCTGMAEFARPGTGVDGGAIDSLDSMAELDRYCYYVAGTVGHMLTALFRLADPSAAPERYAALTERATSFGLGLQLTNIIKDVADDHHRGWSFVPKQLCDEAGVAPEHLFDPAHRPNARRVMDALIAHARAHLARAVAYCSQLRHDHYRIRVFCLTALYFAVRTLRRAETDQVLLDPNQKLKITRGEVYRTVAAAHLVAPSNTLIRAYYRTLL